ncbi:MAG: DUF262 domain-containing protein [Pseudohongiellaceae bacterium]
MKETAMIREPSPLLVDENQVPLDGSDTSNDVPIDEPYDSTIVRVETKNTQMSTMIKRIKNNEINLTPDFQRLGGIWPKVAKSRLIESMLIKIPLPAFYMDASDEDNWLVVDGLQRLSTIKEFVVDNKLELSQLEFLTKYNGHKFNELPRNFQRRIEETDIVLYLIQPGTPARVKFDIFRRINTGGESLSSQEIRHALNQGPVTKYLHDLADSEEFDEATDGGVSPKRMDDRECVLRFLAFTLFNPDDYNNDSFDRFLNEAMAALNQEEKAELKRYESLFKQSMTCAIKIFDRNAFRKSYPGISYRYPVNKALFEAWSVNLGKLDVTEQRELVARSENLKQKFAEMMLQDKEFETSVSQGTGSIRRVKYRFSQIARIIVETLEND